MKKVRWRASGAANQLKIPNMSAADEWTTERLAEFVEESIGALRQHNLNAVFLFISKSLNLGCILQRAVMCIRNNGLEGKDVPNQLLVQDGSGIRGHCTTVFKQLLTTDVVRKACGDLLALLFPNARTDELLAFDGPIPTVADIAELVNSYNPDSNAAMRRSCHKLLCTYNPNAPLSDDVCRWLNEWFAKAQPQDRPVHCVSYEFVPAADAATVFALIVWLSDSFCVELAMAVGANVVLALKTDQADSRSIGALPPVATLTRSKSVHRCLSSGHLSRLRARGLDVRTEDCVGANSIGGGGFASVFASQFEGQPCALKYFNAFFTKLGLDNLVHLLREVKMIAAADHPNIVSCIRYFVWDVHFANTRPCLLLELMDVSLADLLTRSQQDKLALAFAGLATRIDIMKQAALGLAFLHQMTPAVIHRDFKPGNVLLRHCGGDGDAFVAKLSDFGLSQANQAHSTGGAGSSFSVTGAGAGTDWFKSPEQWAKDPHQSTKADVVGFGLTLFSVVCRTKHPWFNTANLPSVQSVDYDDEARIRERGSQGQWPKWPTQVPDIQGSLVATPKLFQSLTDAMFHVDPGRRVPMHVVVTSLQTRRPPSDVIDESAVPVHGAWQSVTTKSLRSKALSSMLDPLTPLPPFLAGLRELESPGSIEDAIFPLSGFKSPTHHSKPFSFAKATSCLEECRHEWRKRKRAWTNDPQLSQTQAATLRMKEDHIVAIMLYTSEGVHRAMNRSLRSQRRERVVLFLPYLKLLLEVCRFNGLSA